MTEDPPRPTRRFAPVSLGFYLLLAAGALLWVRVRGSRPTIARADDWPIDVGLGLVSAALLLVGWLLASRLSPRLRELEELVREIVGDLRADEVILVALASGLVEELFFRGAMLPSWGFVISTLVFGFLHTGPGPVFRAWTVFALLAGALFGGLVVWRGTLLAPIVGHVVVNAVQLWRLTQANVPASGRS